MPSRPVQEWFHKNNVQVRQCPASSPDLNPTENLWEEFDRRIRTKIIATRNRVEFKQKISLTSLRTVT